MSRMIYRVEGEPIRNGDTLKCVGVEVRPNGDAVATVRKVRSVPKEEGATRCEHCGAENGEHKTHSRFVCMGGTFSLSAPILSPAEGSPRCCLCKDTGWRRSVERGRQVPCACGARGVLANTERMALPRIPEGNPGAGNINNCSLANMSAEADCQMCKGECPDRNRFAAKREPARTCTCGHFTSDNLATHAVYCELARNPVPK